MREYSKLISFLQKQSRVSFDLVEAMQVMGHVTDKEHHPRTINVTTRKRFMHDRDSFFIPNILFDMVEKTKIADISDTVIYTTSGTPGNYNYGIWSMPTTGISGISPHLSSDIINCSRHAWENIVYGGTRTLFEHLHELNIFGDENMLYSAGSAVSSYIHNCLADPALLASAQAKGGSGFSKTAWAVNGYLEDTVDRYGYFANEFQERDIFRLLHESSKVSDLDIYVSPTTFARMQSAVSDIKITKRHLTPNANIRDSRSIGADLIYNLGTGDDGTTTSASLMKAISSYFVPDKDHYSANAHVERGSIYPQSLGGGSHNPDAYEYFGDVIFNVDKVNDSNFSLSFYFIMCLSPRTISGTPQNNKIFFVSRTPLKINVVNNNIKNPKPFTMSPVYHYDMHHLLNYFDFKQRRFVFLPTSLYCLQQKYLVLNRPARLDRLIKYLHRGYVFLNKTKPMTQSESLKYLDELSDKNDDRYITKEVIYS